MNQQNEKISVIIIDASAVTRYLLTEILEQSGRIEVVASVHDPAEALNKILTLNPHVITFDVRMPGLDGIAFLKKLWELRPTPVVIVSALTQYETGSFAKAMELGAVGYVAKQSSHSWSGILNLADEIVEKVRSASTIQFQQKTTVAGKAAAIGNF
ncbi:MAG: response regulator [Nitrospirae bacterium]|nr:response regulator [Nitrospirota bacterium]